MKRYISLCIAFSALGCGTVGVTWSEQEQIKPLATMSAETGTVDCGLAPGGKTRTYGLAIFDQPNIAAAEANAITLGGAAYYISVCTQARALDRASGISYGANSVWGNKGEVKTAKALKLAAKAAKDVDDLSKAMEEDWNSRHQQGGEVKPAPAATSGSVVATPNLVDSIDASRNYSELITVLEYEASSNQSNRDHADLCSSLAGLLRTEMNKTTNDFAHDKNEVRRAFKR
jgi:hypothetical protein